MISPDTHIVVRLLVADDALQTSRARELFERGDVLIVKTVLLEAEWVLRSRYQLERALIAEFLQRVSETDGVEFEHDMACRAACAPTSGEWALQMRCTRPLPARWI